MSEKILATICAENQPVYEIVEVEGREFSIVIRAAEDKDKHFELPKSVLCLLSAKLREIYVDECGECDA